MLARLFGTVPKVDFDEVSCQMNRTACDLARVRRERDRLYEDRNHWRDKAHHNEVYANQMAKELTREHSRNQELQSYSDDLESQIELKDQEVEGLYQNQAKHIREIEGLHRRIDEVKADNNCLRQKIADFEAANKRLADRLVAQGAEASGREQLADENSRLKEENAALHERLNDMNSYESCVHCNDRLDHISDLRQRAEASEEREQQLLSILESLAPDEASEHMNEKANTDPVADYVDYGMSIVGSSYDPNWWPELYKTRSASEGLGRAVDQDQNRFHGVATQDGDVPDEVRVQLRKACERMDAKERGQA